MSWDGPWHSTAVNLDSCNIVQTQLSKVLIYTFRIYVISMPVMKTIQILVFHIVYPSNFAEHMANLSDNHLLSISRVWIRSNAYFSEWTACLKPVYIIIFCLMILGRTTFGIPFSLFADGVNVRDDVDTCSARKDLICNLQVNRTFLIFHGLLLLHTPEFRPLTSSLQILYPITTLWALYSPGPHSWCFSWNLRKCLNISWGVGEEQFGSSVIKTQS